MMKSMTWHKSRPVEEALLWTEAKAAEPVDGARGGPRVWKILPLSDNFNDRGDVGCIWEDVNKATRMRRSCGDFLWRWLWWLTSAVNSKSLSTNICDDDDDDDDDSHLPSIPKASPPTFAARCSHIGRQTSRGSLWLGCYSVGYRLIGIKFWKIFIVGHPLNHLL